MNHKHEIDSAICKAFNLPLTTISAQINIAVGEWPRVTATHYIDTDVGNITETEFNIVAVREKAPPAACTPFSLDVMVSCAQKRLDAFIEQRADAAHVMTANDFAQSRMRIHISDLIHEGYVRTRDLFDQIRLYERGLR